MTKEIKVRLELRNEGEHVCIYDNADAALDDAGIKTLFKDALVEKCTIERDGKRLAKLPFMRWERFERALEPYTSR